MYHNRWKHKQLKFFALKEFNLLQIYLHEKIIRLPNNDL